MSDNNPVYSAPAAPAGIPAAAPAPTAKRGWITITLALVATLAVGLFGGILVGHSTAASATTSRGGAGIGGGFGGGFGGGSAGGEGGAGGRVGGAFTAGTIVSVDGNTITLKLTDGNTVKVTTGSDTTVTKTEKSTVSALAAGETIRVAGAKDADGNVTATTVTEGATGFGGARGGAAPGAGAGARN